VAKKEKDLEDVYRSEKTRGRKSQKTPETLAVERLQREIATRISEACSRNHFISILQAYELDDERFRYYLKIFDQWSGQV
jgi:hypothetical protein